MLHEPQPSVFNPNTKLRKSPRTADGTTSPLSSTWISLMGRKTSRKNKARRCLPISAYERCIKTPHTHMTHTSHPPPLFVAPSAPSRIRYVCSRHFTGRSIEREGQRSSFRCGIAEWRMRLRIVDVLGAANVWERGYLCYLFVSSFRTSLYGDGRPMVKGGRDEGPKFLIEGDGAVRFW